MTNKQKLVSIIVLVLLAILVISTVIIKSKKDNSAEETSQVDKEIFEKTIDLKHQYKDGKHIFAGVMEIPSACHSLNLNVTPGDIAELNFSIEDSGGDCTLETKNGNFYVEFEGPADQLFVGKLNGENVNLNTFEVDADLDINEVNIFLKG